MRHARAFRQKISADYDCGSLRARSHPRPDFKRRILQAFADGIAPKPDTTLGNVKADVVDRFVPRFKRANFADIIENSD